MYSFILRKALLLFLSLFLVSSLTFFLIQAVPGSPFIDEQGISEDVLHSLNRHYGLDKPWYVQYGKYLKGLITCDLGPSLKYEGTTVFGIIKEGFHVSFLLGIEALSLSLFLGVLIGTFAAIHRGKWQDHLCTLLSIIGISAPGFIIATVLQFIFAMKLDLFPIARWGSFSHTLLPSISLAAFPTAFIARLTRSKMIEELGQDYVQTARSKGLAEKKVVFKHVLKNSLLPVITYLGPLSSSVLTGSFIIEKIFGIPGLGGWLVKSIASRDYTLIMGITVFYSSILLVIIFLVDIVYTWVDPRIRIDLKGTG